MSAGSNPSLSPSGSGAGSVSGGLPSQYKPADHEAGIRVKWDASGAFHADPGRVLRGEAEPFAIFIPPPNVTGALHLGHALNNTLQDILSRWHRMRGFETLWMPGTDHAGIATQAVVERRLRQEGKLTGPLKEAMTRDEFVAQVQVWKDEYEARITNQLKAMGCSCDFARQRFTMDEICARAVYEAFFRFFKDGLIYRGKRLVNWDPVLQTAVADDECYDEEIDGNFYYLKYLLVSPVRLPGGEVIDHVTVATTRPETYLGDTAVAMNPGDPRATALVGQKVRLPIVGRVVPILQDDYVVLPEAMATTEEAKADPKAKFATGFLKVTPAHDANDHALWERHKPAFAGLPSEGRINILAPDASISDKHGWTDIGEAGMFVGLKREVARKKVVEEFKARGLCEKVVPYRHSVPHSDRSKAIIEPYLSDQWYLRVTDPRMAASANAALAVEQRSTGCKPVPPVGEGGTGAPLGGTSTRMGGTGFQPVPNDLSKPGNRLETCSTGSGGGPSVPVGGTGFQPVQSSNSAKAGSKPVPPITEQFHQSKRNLPHWQVGGSTYFVTFRTHRTTMTPAERAIAMRACQHWHGERMELHAAVVMPDHVHLLLSPFQKEDGTWHSLSELLHSIKRHAALEINKARGTTGTFWQDESFDRIVRDVDEFLEKLAYIRKNPVTAGLVAREDQYDATFVLPEASQLRHAFASRVRGSSGTGWKPVPPDQEGGTSVPPGGTGFQPVPGDPSKPRNRLETCSTGSGTLRFHPARYAKTYEQWHDNIRDWCISRQLWWGHRIPVWHKRATITTQTWERELCPSLGPDPTKGPSFGDMIMGTACGMGVRFVRVVDGRSEDPSRMVPVEREVEGEYDIYICPRLDGLAQEWELEKAGFTRDPDVLDTWFSSALWPLSTLGWPDPDQSPATKGMLDAFNPSSVLSTAREIITLWVSRMVMFNRYLLGEGHGHGPLPFRDVFIHAVVQDGEGKRMSKSAGNGVDPLDIIASHGADAMRFTLCQMTTQTQDVRMPVVKDPKTGTNTSPKFDLGRNVCNKLWNAARFAMGMMGGRDGETKRRRDEVQGSEPAASGTSSLRNFASSSLASSLSLPDRWMLSRLAASLEAINGHLSRYEFSEYAQACYDLLWRDFCDWYLEAIKPTVQQDANQRAVLELALDTILRVLHPLLPFVTEAIWEHFAGPVAQASRLCGGSLTADKGGTPVPLSKIDTGGTPVPPEAKASKRGQGLLCVADWPSLDAFARDDAAEAEFESIRALVGAIREVRAAQQVKPSRKVTLHLPAALAARFAPHHTLIGVLAGIGAFAESTNPPQGPSAAFAFEAQECRVSDLADAVDAGAERTRLEKALQDAEKTIATIEARLANPGYAQKAPPAMVKQSQDQLAKAMNDRDAAKKSLAALGGAGGGATGGAVGASGVDGGGAG